MAAQHTASREPAPDPPARLSCPEPQLSSAARAHPHVHVAHTLSRPGRRAGSWRARRHGSQSPMLSEASTRGANKRPHTQSRRHMKTPTVFATSEPWSMGRAHNRTHHENHFITGRDIEHEHDITRPPHPPSLPQRSRYLPRQRRVLVAISTQARHDWPSKTRPADAPTASTSHRDDARQPVLVGG